MTESDKDAIRALLDFGNTPLEASKALCLQFHHVRFFCEKEQLEPRKFFVGRNIVKATAADAYWPPND